MLDGPMRGEAARAVQEHAAGAVPPSVIPERSAILRRQEARDTVPEELGRVGRSTSSADRPTEPAPRRRSCADRDGGQAATAPRGPSLPTV